MARLESIAKAGYYPTPACVLTLLAGKLIAPKTRIGVMDPCAGEGGALEVLSRHLPYFRVFGLEMERSRFLKLKNRWNSYDATLAQGDFFMTEFPQESVGLLWLNPPYDTDKECSRLEEKFLRRATPLLDHRGLLFFVVPGYALAASAQTLSSNYRNIRCYRFPDPEYAVYKQVVLIADKIAAPIADPDLEQVILDWSRNPEDLPVLDESIPQITVPPHSSSYNDKWKVLGFDPKSLVGFQPWATVKDVNPPVDLARRFQRTFPVASPPRAPHLAAAFAMGLFNGTRVVPRPEASHMPDLLVKGVFHNEYKTIEEKHNSRGELVAEVQVQTPKLAVTALDIGTGIYHQVKSEANLTAPTEVEGMTMADLLDIYGLSLMESMVKACPVLHDPRKGDPEVPLEGLARPLYPAQHSCVTTALKLFEQKDQGVILMGEIGSGKTSVALATAHALKSQHVLVMCPPHLLEGWREQVEAVVPHYQVKVLDSIQDVRDFATTKVPTVALLSRERAKLGHGWVSVKDRCPSCHTPLEDRDYSVKRERCSSVIRTPANPVAQWMQRHGLPLVRYLGERSLVLSAFNHAPKVQGHFQTAPVEEFDAEAIRPHLIRLMEITKDPAIEQWLSWVDPTLAIPLYERSLRENANPDQAMIEHQKLLLLSSPPGSEYERVQHLYGVSWAAFDKQHAYIHGREDKYTYDYTFRDYADRKYRGAPMASSQALLMLLLQVRSKSVWRERHCDEFLYQAVPEPRRYPLATWITHNVPDCMDFLILDECHEVAGDGTAQAHAAQRLLQTKAPTMLLSGSLSNGYADSLFGSMQAVSPKFRAAFGRKDRVAFIDRYGYWKRVVRHDDVEQVKSFGSNSDRVMKITSKAGQAPGVVPMFLLEHLLPVAVTLQKEDLRIGIPPTSEHVSKVFMTGEIQANYLMMKEKLITLIKQTRFKPGYAGKLWGALTRLPTYLDRAACGPFELRWPENVPEVGGELICEVPQSDPSILLPKEQWMLDTVASELNEGRNVMIFGWHSEVCPRLMQLLQDQGFDPVYLEADKVPTGKRQAWITKNVVKPNKRILIVNPVAVQTGLNNLVHFHSVLWMENPACNPFVFRQAFGRIDRIGQTMPTRSLFPLYEDSAQEPLHKLLLHKVGVSRSVDGLDPEAALLAAGVAEQGYAGYSVGRELFRMLTGE